MRAIRRSLVLALLSAHIAACDAEAPPPILRLNLETCIGEPAPDAGLGDPAPDAGLLDESCRTGLIDETGVEHAGCFVARAADGTLERRALRWQQGSVRPAEAGHTAYVSGQQITAALFFGSRCGELLPATRCADTQGCLHKLGPIDQVIALEGETVIDFTRDGVCRVESGTFRAGEVGEPCDGVDNDCDTAIDEAVALGDDCTAGIGACTATGDRLVCHAGARVCGDADGPVVAASPGRGDASCNGTDDDCDGIIDEGGDCDRCIVDAECGGETPQCVSGDCQPCDPSDDAGCDAPARPVCRVVDGTPTCVGCANDDDCVDAAGPYCVDGRCGRCVPGDAERGCDPVGPEPICDAQRLECVACATNVECRSIDPGRSICSRTGHCGECIASVDCARFASTPRCEDRRCVGCGDDAFCRTVDPERSQCLPDGRCAECDPESHDGCAGILPICDESLFCRSCVPGDCLVGDCFPSGECVACDPSDRSTCLFDPFSVVEPAPPVCDPTTLDCVECLDSGDCVGHPFGPECVDGLCACGADGTRCELNGTSPVCRDGACVACGNDSDCEGNPFGSICDLDGPGIGDCN